MFTPVSSETVRQCVSSESVCVLKDRVCPQRQCVSPESVCVLRVSETVCPTKAHYRGHILGFKRFSWRIFRTPSTHLLRVHTPGEWTTRSMVLSYLSRSHVIMSWSLNIFLPNATRGRCNLHIDTIPDVLPAVLPAFSSCDWVSFILDHVFVLL